MRGAALRAAPALALAVALAAASVAPARPPQSVVRLVPIGWSEYRPSGTGRALVIRYETNLTGPLAGARIAETRSSVRIRLLKRVVYRRAENGRLVSDQTADLRIACTTIRLAAPVASRRVLAAVGRRTRPARRDASIPRGCAAPPRVRPEQA